MEIKTYGKTMFWQKNLETDMDYLYYLHNRINSILSSLYSMWFRDIFPVNVYLNLKNNGDVNANFDDFKIKNIIKKEVRVIHFFNFADIVPSVLDEFIFDFIEGKFGEYVYSIDYDENKKMYELRIIHKSQMKSSYIKKVVGQLKKYREGEVDSEANEKINKYYRIWSMNGKKWRRKDLCKIKWNW